MPGMCGRYASYLPPEAIARFFRTTNALPDIGPSWNVAPGQQAMVDAAINWIGIEIMRIMYGSILIGSPKKYKLPEAEPRRMHSVDSMFAPFLSDWQEVKGKLAGRVVRRL